MNASIGITNLSREGARYAAVHAKDGDDDASADKAISDYVRNNAPPGIKPEDLTIAVSPPCAERVPQTAIKVAINYDMKKKLFLPSKIFNVTFFSDIYRSEGQMMIEPN